MDEELGDDKLQPPPPEKRRTPAGDHAKERLRQFALERGLPECDTDPADLDAAPAEEPEEAPADPPQGSE